ncbi:MAG: hypothetical protein KGL39_04430 [Patescibacteria group bacterium]|nr:hypothetical protein [Patescibacteria group bacterium]
MGEVVLASEDLSRAAYNLLCGLVLESGKRWGDVATDFQIADAKAILSPERPNWHFLTRPRGGSKSSDIGGIALIWVAVMARPLANGHVVAASSEQANIIIDAMAGFVARTPELNGVVTVAAKKIVAANGAWVEVLAQSDSGAWGLRDAHLLVCDEFCQWPETRGAKRVWTAMISTAPKVPNCKFIVMSSAGEPSHWSRDIFERCKINPLWRVSETPGPVPWMSPEELASLRDYELRPSEYDRLVLNIWAEDEDRAISVEDWDAAVQPYTSLEPRPGVKYIITVDIGITNDAAVMCVMHREHVDPNDPDSPYRVVVDHIERWKGSKKKPVQITAVEQWLTANAPRWNKARVWADPTQFMGNIQDLRKRGIRADEYKFTATSVGEIASALVRSFRSRQIIVPDIAVLKDELLKVRLRESSPGVTRLDHDKGGHDDQAVAIGMGCEKLLGHQGAYGEMFKKFIDADIERRQKIKQAREAAKLSDEHIRLAAQFGARRTAMAQRRKAAIKRCQHRWDPTGAVCVFCQSTRESVLENA